MAAAMRGLTLYILDIRNCNSKEQEVRRVEKELAHIRSKFASASKLDGYGHKKYVWKLLYTYMLGYDVEIGHMEALKLITSSKYSEKNAGYMACATLFNENHELLRLTIQTIKKDLMPKNDDGAVQCLALSLIANVGGAEYAESLATDVQTILLSGKSRSFVRKKAALALLRLFRKYPDAIPRDPDFAVRIISLLDDNLGVVTSVVSLLLGLVSNSTKGYEEAPVKAIYLLTKLSFSKERKSVYKYYLTLCPWLQVKLLRFLQYFPPPADQNVMSRLTHVLTEILTKTEMLNRSNRNRRIKNVNKNNADHSILFEAVNVIIHLCAHGHTELRGQAFGRLRDFISASEANFRYLGLETMTNFVRNPDSLAALNRHDEKQAEPISRTVLKSLEDPDVSIRKRAMDLLYAMCYQRNAKEIVDRLLKYMQTAPVDLKEELALKIAILAERFAEDLKWYLDVILQVIRVAGDFVSEDIWHRAVQIVTNNEGLQDYAATTCYEFLKGQGVHESGVRVGSYILGEFGHKISDKSITGDNLLDLLLTHLKVASRGPKGLILSAMVKMANTYPHLKQRINEVFETHRAYVDAEIQQRACEYYAMSKSVDENLMNMVFDVMPNFPERESTLLKLVDGKQNATADRNVWLNPEGEGDKEGEDDDGESGSDDSGSDDSDDDDDDDDDGSGSDDSSSDESDSDEDEDGTFPEQASKLVDALFFCDSGILYESSSLQIGAKLRFEANGQCKMVLYLGNKTSQDMTNVSGVINSGGSFNVQAKPTGQFAVAGNKQEQYLVLWQCLRPFDNSPTMTLSFAHRGSNHQLSLTMPLLMTHFVEPKVINSQVFKSAWGKVGNELRVNFKLDGPAYVEALAATLSDVKLAVVEGADPNPNNICASGTFCVAPQGKPISMPCMVRVETKPGVDIVRVTVHAGHSSVSKGAVSSIRRVLNATQL